MPRASVSTRSASSLACPIPPVRTSTAWLARVRPRRSPSAPPWIHEANDDFSFSGLKTSVGISCAIIRRYSRTHKACAIFARASQAAIVDVLVAKTLRAAKRPQGPLCDGFGWSFLQPVAPGRPGAGLCPGGHPTPPGPGNPLHRQCRHDRVVAERKLLRGHEPTPFTAEIMPNWPLN